MLLKSPLFVFFILFVTVCLMFQLVTEVIKFTSIHSYPAFVQFRQYLKTIYLTNLEHLS